MRAELANGILETNDVGEKHLLLFLCFGMNFFFCGLERIREAGHNERGGVIFTHVNELGRTGDWTFVDQ